MNFQQPTGWYGHSPFPQYSSTGSSRPSLINRLTSARDSATNALGNAWNRMRGNSTPPPGSWNSSFSSSGNSTPTNSSTSSLPGTGMMVPWYNNNNQFNPNNSTTTNSISPNSNTDFPTTGTNNEGIQTRKYKKGDQEAFEVSVDASKIDLQSGQSTKIEVAGENGQTAFTTVITRNADGSTIYDVHRGQAPNDIGTNGTLNTSGAGVQGQPQNGWLNNGFNSSGQQTSADPPIDLNRVPTLMDLVDDQNPNNIMYGMTPVDWSKFSADTSGRELHEGKSFAEWLSSKAGQHNWKGIDSVRSTLLSTADWIQNRYHTFDPTKQSGVGDTILNEQQAKKLASEYIDAGGLSDNPWEQQFAQAKLHDFITNDFHKGQVYSVVNESRPDSTNTNSSISNTAYNGKTLSEWSRNLVGPTGPYGYSNDQSEAMKMFVNMSEHYGDDLCKAAGFSSEATRVFSSQVGSLMTEELLRTGRTAPDDLQKDWAMHNLLKAKNVYDNLSEPDKETYRSLVSGKLAPATLNSTTNQTTASASTGSNTGTNTTQSGSSSNPMWSSFNPSMNSAGTTTSSGIPAGSGSSASDFIRSGRPQRSAMKGGRVSFNPETNEREFTRDSTPQTGADGNGILRNVGKGPEGRPM
ncbi:uncharacterized protein L201_004809 [Kwoniella dendrophila CBS 6074]|uniref:Uncharacterized protein n=1 Tax=Kwoniella dendrophila CBS 6074 TaxID=1295534 RepID=A0AAX4JWW8_9TREE